MLHSEAVALCERFGVEVQVDDDLIDAEHPTFIIRGPRTMSFYWQVDARERITDGMYFDEDDGRWNSFTEEETGQDTATMLRNFLCTSKRESVGEGNVILSVGPDPDHPNLDTSAWLLPLFRARFPGTVRVEPGLKITLDKQYLDLAQDVLSGEMPMNVFIDYLKDVGILQEAVTVLV